MSPYQSPVSQADKLRQHPDVLLLNRQDSEFGTALKPKETTHSTWNVLRKMVPLWPIMCGVFFCLFCLFLILNRYNWYHDFNIKSTKSETDISTRRSKPWLINTHNKIFNNKIPESVESYHLQLFSIKKKAQKTPCSILLSTNWMLTSVRAHFFLPWYITLYYSHIFKIKNPT